MEEKVLSREEQIKLGAELLHLTYEEAENYTHEIDNSDAIYISVPIRGGDSLIVGTDGQVLYANSSIDPKKHLEEYNKGRRTPISSFNKDSLE